MIRDFSIEQARLTATAQSVSEPDGSAGFREEWREPLQALVRQFGFGELPVSALFARPLSRSHVAIIRVEPQPERRVLNCHVLILGRELYAALGDPFAIAARFPSPSQHEPLMSLTWPNEPLPPRRVSELQTLLRTGDSGLLLGAAQALVDGGRVWLSRATPSDEARQVWQLLPDSVRAEAWPANWTFQPDLGASIIVAPPEVPLPEGYLSEEQVRDYPESRYELSLQTAIEAGDEAWLASLLARPSNSAMLRFALGLLVAASVVLVLVRLAGAR